MNSMKSLKAILIILIVVAIAVFTGTWLFDILGWLANFAGEGFYFLSDIFNLFGWNNGILGG